MQLRQQLDSNKDKISCADSRSPPNTNFADASGNQGSILPQQLKPPRLAELLRVFVLPPLRLDVTLPLSVCLSLAYASDRRSGCATSSAV